MTNGGAAPSDATKLALHNFCAGLDTDSLTASMLAVNCIVPDSLIAATTPLIKGPGNDPWTNTNFVAGDLTVAGIKGNASNKYLDTGVNPNTEMTATTSAGVTLYMPDLAGSAGSAFTESGIISSNLSSDNFGLFPALNSVTHWNCCGWAVGGEATAVVNLSGYYSGNRIANNDNRIFFANSTNPHGTSRSDTSGSPQCGI